MFRKNIFYRCLYNVDGGGHFHTKRGIDVKIGKVSFFEKWFFRGYIFFTNLWYLKGYVFVQTCLVEISQMVSQTVCFIKNGSKYVFSKNNFTKCMLSWKNGSAKGMALWHEYFYYPYPFLYGSAPPPGIALLYRCLFYYKSYSLFYTLDRLGLIEILLACKDRYQRYLIYGC